MGRKGKANKGTSAGEDEAPVSPEQRQLLASVGALLDALSLDEAIAKLDAELPPLKGACGALEELNGQAMEMRRFLEAEGVASVGEAEGVALELGEEVEAGGAPAGAGGTNSGGGATPFFGRKLVTSRSFRKGEVVLREQPLLVAPMQLCTLGRGEGPGHFDPAARATYDALTPVQRRLLGAFEASMHGLPASLASRVEAEPGLEAMVRFARVMAVNAHEYMKESGKAALYLLVSRANHSCDPVCALGSTSPGELSLYALRDMDAGEEVLYSYLGGHFTLHPTPARRRQLLQTKLFECHCARCLAAEDGAYLPCAVGKCGGFLTPVGSSGGAACSVWRCGVCGAEEEESSDRIAGYRRLEPLWAKKVQDLEVQWHNPNKDPAKYINDWVSLAKMCGKMLGGRHHVYARACFFGIQALNSGRAMGVGGVDIARHAEGAEHLGFALLDYTAACCPHGCRCVLLEPIAHALLLLGSDSKQRCLCAELVRRSGREELQLPLLGPEATAALQRIIDKLDM